MKNLSPQQKSAMTVAAKTSTLPDFLIKYKDNGTKKELTSHYEMVQGIETLIGLEAKKLGKEFSKTERAVIGSEFKKELETVPLKDMISRYEASEEDIATYNKEVAAQNPEFAKKLAGKGKPEKEPKAPKAKKMDDRTSSEKVVKVKVAKVKVEKTPKVAKTNADGSPIEKVRKVRESKVLELTESQKEIVDDESVSKSEKFKKLYDKGLSISQITKAMDTHYSFVQSVINKHTAVAVGE